MRFFFRVLFLGVFVLSGQASATEKSELPENCLAAREFITTLRFLRHHGEFKISEYEGNKVADQVSRGCTGAAKRFIEVTNLLLRIGVSTPNAIKKGIRFAGASQKEVKTYIKVFQRAFIAEYLDLDLSTASRLAEDLSVGFKGDSRYAREDFEEISEFCLEESGLDLTKPACSYLAWDVAKAGEKYKDGAAENFLDVLEFIQDEKGPSRSVGEALALAKEVISFGPQAVQNFKNGYRFAVSSSGLKQGYIQAMGFARKMASRSLKGVEMKLEPRPKTLRIQRRLGSTR